MGKGRREKGREVLETERQHCIGSALRVEQLLLVRTYLAVDTPGRSSYGTYVLQCSTIALECTVAVAAATRTFFGLAFFFLLPSILLSPFTPPSPSCPPSRLLGLRLPSSSLQFLPTPCTDLHMLKFSWHQLLPSSLTLESSRIISFLMASPPMVP